MVGTLGRSEPSMLATPADMTVSAAYLRSCYELDRVDSGKNYEFEFGDSFSCDGFRMYEFKIRRCARGRSHDWTECPYAHPGEKARRRDPRRYRYSGTACPEFRRGVCLKGDSCEYAHGVFECWLHPSKYRTQACKDGTRCARRVCFFAHTAEQLRIVPPESYESPPVSPGTNSVGELVSSIRRLSFSPSKGCSVFSPSYRVPSLGAIVDESRVWGRGCCDDEAVMELQGMIMEKIGKRLGMEKVVESSGYGGAGPDLGWVAELVNTVS